MLSTQDLAARSPVAMLIARVLIVIGLIPNGLRKIVTFDMTANMMGGAPPIMIDGRMFPQQEPLFFFPLPGLFLAAAIVFDILGALLVIAGFKARAVAGFLAFYAAFAMLIYHSDINGPQDVQAILRNLPLVGGLIILAAVGAGRWSVDGWLARRN